MPEMPSGFQQKDRLFLAVNFAFLMLASKLILEISNLCWSKVFSINPDGDEYAEDWKGWVVKSSQLSAGCKTQCHSVR